VQGEYNLTVNRNGQIDIPKVGVVQVSGLTYRQLREVMDREFARQYNNFQMNVTLDNLRTIQVYVVGQSRFPGSYAVSSLSTLVNALFASGGPSKSGSMRNIQVRRGGKVTVTFDMYDFLLRGDKSKDIRLQPEDVIFIPPIGPVAAIGIPKSMQEVGEALKTLARVELQTPSTPVQESSWQQRENLTWQQRENLSIMAAPKEGVKPGSIPKSWTELEFEKNEAEFEKRFQISLPEAVNKLAMSNGVGFRRTDQGAGDL
jgi:hypothetical protein